MGNKLQRSSIKELFGTDIDRKLALKLNYLKLITLKLNISKKVNQKLHARDMMTHNPGICPIVITKSKHANDLNMATHQKFAKKLCNYFQTKYYLHIAHLLPCFEYDCILSSNKPDVSSMQTTHLHELLFCSHELIQGLSD